jgi:hypothetical protein
VAESGTTALECALAGIVTGAAGGIEGAVIKLLRLDAGAGLSPRSTRSAAAGRFTLPGLPCGLYRATAFAPGYLTAAVELELPSAGEARIELVPDPGSTVLVTDAEDRPVAGAAVRLLARTDGFAGRVTAARTDAAGRARLEGGPTKADAPVAIEVRHGREPPQRFTFSAGELREGQAHARLNAAGWLGGIVVDASGAPAPDATVTLLRDGQTVKAGLATTADGRFELQGIAAGKYDLVAVTADRGCGRLDGIEVGAAQRRQDLTVQLAPGPATLAVRVVDGADRPVRNARIRLTPGPGPALHGIAGEDGAFRFAGLPEPGAAGVWIIDVEKQGYARVEQRLADAALETRVVLERTGSIAGAVSRGGDLDSFTIVAELEGAARNTVTAGRRYQSSATTRQFRLANLAPGTYTLSAVVAGSVLARKSGVIVRAGEETRDVDLPAE